MNDEIEILARDTATDEIFALLIREDGMIIGGNGPLSHMQVFEWLCGDYVDYDCSDGWLVPINARNWEILYAKITHSAPSPS